MHEAAGTRTEDGSEADILRMRRDLPTLEAVERRRGQLWIIAGLLLMATSASVFVLLADPDAADVIPDSFGVRLGFAGVSVAFLLYVFDQERRLRRLSEALVRERVLSAALTSRVRDLKTLSRVGQVVNAVLSMREVLEVVLEGAFELTEASRGSVLLVEGGELAVAVSAGQDAAPRGSRQPMTSGVAGWVATHREPLAITGHLHEGQLPQLQERTSRDGGSSVCAPMMVADELVGVLALERHEEQAAFSEWEMRAVTLFASHAATAVSNSLRYEQERLNVERLAQLVETQGEYVARMVHDLKSPLTAIIGFSKLIGARADLEEDTRRSFVTRIEEGAFQLLEMIEGVLEGASEDAQHDVRRDPVDVCGVVRELADMTASMARGRDGVSRQVAVDCPDTVMLPVDGAALRSILVNLLENAAKYSPAGSPITVTVTRSDREVSIGVRDEGDGIPEDDIETVFERFRQRDPSGGPRGGVGLGLYIVRSLVQAQGGRVAVTSRVGAGSTFTVSFPDRLPLPVDPPAGAVPGRLTE